MDCLSPYSKTERVVFMKGSQLGATECGNNWIGFVIHHTPGPMLSVLPTVEMAKRTSKQRLDPLIDESPVLRERIKPARSRDSGNTILTKEFQGGVLILTGANSATGLRSMPVRFLFLDEIDAYPGDIDDEGEAPDWQRLYERREDYKIGTVPAGAFFVTAGVDVQKDRIEASLWAWGREKECWLVEHRVLEGDTSRDAVWNRLSALLGECWRHESGCDIKLSRMAIDCGYATQEVYDWARKFPSTQVIAVKGVQRGAALVGSASAVETSLDGKKLRRGMKIRPVCGHIAKLELFGNLRKNPPTDESGDPYPPGYVHLPKMDEEFVKQLCSEQLVTKRNRAGYPIREWQKLRKRNEALDCYVYARAAAALHGLDRFSERHWREMETHLQGLAVHSDDPVSKPVKQGGRRVRSRGIRT